jgi:hypothetical protein
MIPYAFIGYLASELSLDVRLEGRSRTRTGGKA